MKRFLCLCLILLSGIPGYTQMLAYYQNLNIDTLFYLDKNQHVEPIDFYFPSFLSYKTQNTGYKISSIEQLVHLKRYNKSKISNPTLFLRCHVENIKNIKLYISNNHVNKLMANIAVKSDGYQAPLEINIDSLSSDLEKNALLDLNISYEPVDKNKNTELMIGDIYLANVSINRLLSPVQLFQNPPFSNTGNIENQERHAFDSYGIFKHFPADQFEENYKGTILIEEKPTSNNAADNSTISALTLALMKNYLFFKERKLNRDSTLRAAVILMERYKSAPVCDFVDTLNEFITNVFKDPHFQIRKKCAVKKTQTPVYTYQLGGKQLIAAVFDDELKERIPLGSEIIAVNGTRFPDSAPASKYKTEQFLKREEGTQMTIKIKLGDGAIVDIPYTVKSNYKIPGNFKPQNYSFKFLNDTVSYYRVDKISPFLHIDFINKLDSINSRKKLIIDLRGNGGGDLIGGAQFASCFIDHAFKYSGFFNSNTNAMDSILVNENKSPFHFRRDGRIVILIDEHTACAAELVAMTLRAQNKNVSIVGKSSSGGALAFVYELILKRSAVTIMTNSLNTGKLVSNHGTLEGNGIHPDVLVQINKIQDLQPYDDKVLKIAISK